MLLALATLLVARAEPVPAPADPAATPAEVPAPPRAPVPVDPAVLHEELRAVRTTLLDALGKKDLDAALALLAPDVVFTTTDGEALMGREAVKTWIASMTEGPDAPVRSFSYDVRSDDLSVLIGDDVAVAWGPSTDHYTLASGETWDLGTRWSATLVKLDGHWQIASIHSSVDLFDNPVLDASKGWILKAGMGGLVVGILAGLVVGALAGRALRT